MINKFVVAVVLTVSVWASALSAAQETSPTDAYAKAYEQATGEAFVPEDRAPLNRGRLTTDMWDIFVDAWEPYADHHRIYPDQLHQSEVWDWLGVPDAYAINRSDLYIFAYDYLVIYYDEFGYSQVVLWLPDTTYQ